MAADNEETKCMSSLTGKTERIGRKRKGDYERQRNEEECESRVSTKQSTNLNGHILINRLVL